MFERPQSGERALLVHLNLPAGLDTEDALQEFQDLALSAGAEVVGWVKGSRQSPDSRYFAGSGKVEELAERVSAEGIELVLFNHQLSPSQERNLERRLKCRVLDRTGLILDIFSQRARSHEGKLQVELAQLRHLSTRLVRGWTHLERQKGGIGLRGPGETQLETDRRLLGIRIKQLSRRLEKVQRQREQNRRRRVRAETPTVALVGYTNAGKSTLFNRLTGAEVYAEDQLFATLDPMLRRLDLPSGGHAVLADTVGFVRELPHELVAAFRATLQETREATVLLHVIDASDPERDERIEQVDAVLSEVGADEVPQIQVFNKIDMTDLTPRLDRSDGQHPARVWTSAITGAGEDLLLEAIAEAVSGERVHGVIHVPPTGARMRARLFELGAVVEENHAEDGGWDLEVELPRADYDQLRAREGLPESRLEAGRLSP